MGGASGSGCTTGKKKPISKQRNKKKSASAPVYCNVFPVIKIGIKITELLVAVCSHVPVLMLHTSDSCSMMVIGSVCLLIPSPPLSSHTNPNVFWPLVPKHTCSVTNTYVALSYIMHALANIGAYIILDLLIL